MTILKNTFRKRVSIRKGALKVKMPTNWYNKSPETRRARYEEEEEYRPVVISTEEQLA
jgi:hypothetical protein